MKQKKRKKKKKNPQHNKSIVRPRQIENVTYQNHSIYLLYIF